MMTTGKYFLATKREVKKMIAQKQPPPLKVEPHHSGKGTKARINTIAEKMLFNSHISN